MLGYNLWLAARSVRRNPVLSILIIGGIALGITIATSFITLHHVLAQDPLPDRSSRLHYVRLDSWDPARAYPGDAEKPIPPHITYPDMRGIMKSGIPARENGGFKANLYVYPEKDKGRPFRAVVRLCFSDFFRMFEVPFAHGGPWPESADEGPEQVIVIDHATNDTLFGGGNSVGRTVRLDEREFKVVGVLAPWRPTIKMYDMTQFAYQEPEAIYMPFNFVEPMEIRTAGNTDNWKANTDNTPRGFLYSETAWLQFWVELEDERKVQEYRDFLEAYVMEQKKLGRFQRPLDVRLTPLPALIEEFQVVPEETKGMMLISLLFLTVCALNLTGLLLGKFLARAPEVGVRRALGASRRAVFLQHVVECEFIGIVGGAIGLLLSMGVLFLFNKSFPFGEVFHLDAAMAGASILLSLVAGLLAGLYPAWRVCTLPPAAHLRLG
ncbi:MAG TPA: ABC transporter permease [Candidatus Polarisedimenticolia bacterium]|nr:ABC transporter permease [Candidatus Polarisedimenticolia bacterium]